MVHLIVVAAAAGFFFASEGIAAFSRKTSVRERLRQAVLQACAYISVVAMLELLSVEQPQVAQMASVVTWGIVVTEIGAGLAALVSVGLLGRSAATAVASILSAADPAAGAPSGK